MAQIMGIVNVTPNSFSDGGRFLDPARAIEHGRALAAEGADILDVGGESTRPGAEAVPAEEERERVLGVVEGLAGGGVPISIDTSKANVAAAAIDSGATIVNDVTACSDPEMAPLCAERGVELILMHMLGTPRTMQADPTYDDVVADVGAFLVERAERASAAGVAADRIMVDPGIGFGKTVTHNLELLARLGELAELGYPIVVGASRKSFIGKLSGREVSDRLGGSVAAAVAGAANGAEVVRVHDVAATRDALMVATAIDGREWREDVE